MIDKLLAEATEYEFKEALETKKPKSWLKQQAGLVLERGCLFFRKVIYR